MSGKFLVLHVFLHMRLQTDHCWFHWPFLKATVWFFQAHFSSEDDRCLAAGPWGWARSCLYEWVGPTGGQVSFLFVSLHKYTQVWWASQQNPFCRWEREGKELPFIPSRTWLLLEIYCWAQTYLSGFVPGAKLKAKNKKVGGLLNA